MRLGYSAFGLLLIGIGLASDKGWLPPISNEYILVVLGNVLFALSLFARNPAPNVEMLLQLQDDLRAARRQGEHWRLMAEQNLASSRRYREQRNNLVRQRDAAVRQLLAYKEREVPS